MSKRVLAVFLVLALLLSACDALISKAVESVSKAIESNPPQIIVTKEVVVKTIEQVIVTTTPIPTPTLTPVPAYLGNPIQPEKALRQAVEVSLAALGQGLQVRLFTRAPNGEVVVWVRDDKYPDTLLCGIPQYFEGVGSILVLTTGNLYKVVNQSGTFPEADGCIGLSLGAGKEQLKKLLEYYQGLYQALRTKQRFSSADGVKYYVSDYLSKLKGGIHPYEINLVFFPLFGEDLSKTSVEIECPRNMGGSCQGAFRYSFTGTDIDYEQSAVRHVPLAYSRFFEQRSGGNELLLLSEQGRKLMQMAQLSALKTPPLTTNEILTAWLYQSVWEQLVYSGAFTAGVGSIFSSMDVEVKYTNPAFAPLQPFSGVTHALDGVISQYGTLMMKALNGQTESVSDLIVSGYITQLRSQIRSSYLDYIVFTVK